IVLYPESTPIDESYRAMTDLKAAGVETHLVIANMLLPEQVCTNDFFKKRRLMQMKYLSDIENRFRLPVMSYPLKENEIKGIEQLKKESILLFETENG
ncbi:MAG: ArsA-related P-loop ATPase, partial [Planctomycetota bacterium]